MKLWSLILKLFKPYSGAATMMTEKGIIKEIKRDGKAVVQVQRGSCCAHCSAANTCHSLEGKDKEMLVEAINNLSHIRVGDEVEISLPTRSFLSISFFVYFVPIVALVSGALFGEKLASFLLWDSTLTSLLVGSSAMAVTFLILKWFDRGLGSTTKYQPSITRLLLCSDFHQYGDNK